MKLALFLAACFAQSTAAGEFSAIRTATGILVAHEEPGNRFTVEIPGNQVESLQHPQHFFLKIDGVPFQVQTATRDEIFGKPVEITQKGLLLAHRDWEKRHLEKALNAALALESALVPMSDGTDALSWSYSMPKGMDAEVGRQLYLTCATGGSVVVVNAAVLKDAKEDAIRKTLLAAANSVRFHDAPIDLAKLQAAAKNPPPAPAAKADPGGTYEFILNQRGGGIRIVSAAKPPRLEFFDDYGDGVETIWDADLTPLKDGGLQTERGLAVRIEKLAGPVTYGGKRCEWKLRISGKNPGYREHQKIRPHVDFDGAGNDEYFGNLVSAGEKPAKPENKAALTPPAGSPERNAIMDVLRFNFYKDEKKARENPDKILFTVHHLKVKDGWACVNVTPTKNGKEVAEPRWKVLRHNGKQWEDVDYYQKLLPLETHEESWDAIDMGKASVKRLLPMLPGCPAEIFPSAAQ